MAVTPIRQSKVHYLQKTSVYCYKSIKHYRL